MPRNYFLLFVLIAFCSCDSFFNPHKPTKFKLLTPVQTGIDFSNDISESQEFNIINYQDFYSGGGVSIGDINNDELADIFFTGNMVQNRLYINKGNLKFEDITEKAGLTEKDYTWTTGSTMVDVNNDGWLDIYVSYSGLVDEEQRKNKMWINQGNNTFIDEAAKYNIDHAGYSVNANFFDFDKDGDLDMYLVNQGPEKNPNFNKSVSRLQPNEFCGDKLYRNDQGIFVDVTLSAGIYSSLIGFGHGAAVGDVNNDGWEDLYVCNDFFEYDYLYINNSDGTFTESMKNAIKHTSNFSMGNDMADFNNDELLDIVVVDMVAEDNRRKKSMLSGMKPDLFWRAFQQGYHYQFMVNTLQLNNGNMTFSEIGHLAGISNTDWSWGPLFADFDNDGNKDLFISNGLRKDIRNRDWAKRFNELLNTYSTYELFSSKEWDDMLKSLPSEKIPNYIYQQSSPLQFTNVTSEWGLETPSFSNGAAYGDLDNDGDLDLVVNNIDDKAFVYENMTRKEGAGNYLSVKLNGSEQNKMALGTIVIITQTDGTKQMQQHYLTRGYRSSVQPNLYFGCGTDTVLSKVEILWPDNTKNEIVNVKANQQLTVDYEIVEREQFAGSTQQTKIFMEAGDNFGIVHHYRENNFDPYQFQPLLPYKISEPGPIMAVADVNNDGRDDVFIGGAYGFSSTVFIQTVSGDFKKYSVSTWENDDLHEDTGAAFFDADNDGDLDLYTVSGGYEFEVNSDHLADRLYINDGQGNFVKSIDKIPSIKTPGSKVVPADFDNDGDMDLLLTGSFISHQYPLPASSYILINEGGFFKDETSSLAPDLANIGMVKDAQWSDIDLDGDLDIVLVGEWMPITIIENIDGTFKKVKEQNGLQYSSGWWNTIEKFDADGDGDDDFVAGNLGWNHKYKASEQYPFEVFTDDFDDNGRQDIVFAYYQQQTLYPLENLDRLALEFPELKNRYKYHNDFAEATMSDVYGKTILEQARNYQINTFSTSFIENLGNGNFGIKPLPVEAQISCTNTICTGDFNHDQLMDILIAGNLYGTEVESVRMDSGIGLLLVGDGKNNFNAMSTTQSGFFADGDVKSMKKVVINGSDYILIGRNSGETSLVKYTTNAEL